MKTNSKTQSYLTLALLFVLGLQVSFPWMKDSLKNLDLASEETSSIGERTIRICGVDHRFAFYRNSGESEIRMSIRGADGLESTCSECQTRVLGFQGRQVEGIDTEQLFFGINDAASANLSDLTDIVIASLDQVVRDQVMSAYGDGCEEVAIEDEEEPSHNRTRLTERQRDEIFSCNLVEDSREEDGVRSPTVDERASCRLRLLNDIAEGRVDKDDLDRDIRSARDFRDFIRDLAAPTEDLIEDLLESDDSSDVQDGVRLARELERAVSRAFRSSVANRLLADGARRITSASLEEYKDDYSERMQARISQGEYRRSLADVTGEIEDLNGESDRLWDRYGRYNDYARDLIQRGLDIHTNGSLADRIRFNAEMADLRRVRPEYVDAVNAFLREHDRIWSGREGVLDRLEGLSSTELAALSEYSRIFGRDTISEYRNDFYSLYDQVNRIGMMNDDIRDGTYRPDGMSIANLYSTRTTTGLLAQGGQSLITALPQPNIGWTTQDIRNIMSRVPSDPMRSRTAADRRVETGRSGIPRAGMPVRTL